MNCNANANFSVPNKPSYRLKFVAYTNTNFKLLAAAMPLWAKNEKLYR